MKQCDNGHFYDENRFDSCPYCQEGAGVGKTVAASSVGENGGRRTGRRCFGSGQRQDGGHHQKEDRH